MKSKNVRYLLLFLTIILMLTIFLLIKYSGLINIQQLHEFIISFGMLAPLVFIIFYIIVSLLGVPTTLLAIFAGTIFGVGVGWVLVIISATISANVAFIIARYFKKTFFKIKVKNNQQNKISNLINRIEKSAQKNGFITILILRMSFLPYIPLSYAAGFVKNLKMKEFTLATFLTNSFGSFFFIFLGFSITQSLPYFILAIILIIVILQISKLIKTKYKFKE